MSQCIRRLLLIVGISCVVSSVAACQQAAAPSLAPTAPPVGITLLSEAIAAGAPSAQQPVTLAGYVFATTQGLTFVSRVAFGPEGSALPAEPAVVRVWLGEQNSVKHSLQLRTAGGVQYAPALVRGALEGPGRYGSAGAYTYQMSTPAIEAWSPVETTVGELLDQPQAYVGRLVRINGGLLVRDGVGLLVDRLGPGGIPEQKARQIKLRGAINEEALLAHLKRSAGGLVYFGQVQVEGVVRAGLLVPLAIIPVQ